MGVDSNSPGRTYFVVVSIPPLESAKFVGFFNALHVFFGGGDFSTSAANDFSWKIPTGQVFIEIKIVVNFLSF